MTVDNDTLPEFSNPPLNEVLLSVQFEPLQHLVVPEIGLLWQHYGSRFSHVEQHPPIDPVIERFGVREPRSPFPGIQLMSGAPPLPRVWFLNDEKTQLLQIQQDRFIRNWRRVKGDESYPRYIDCIRPNFLTDFEDFQKFLSENNIGDVKVNQCEVSYINHLYSGDQWSSHSEIGNIFNVWESNFNNDSKYEIEDATFQFRTVIRDEKGEFIGRLHVVAQPGFIGADETPIFSLNLTARGRPLSSDMDGIIKFMDLGRDMIVRLFTDITTQELHKAWGKTDI